MSRTEGLPESRGRSRYRKSLDVTIFLALMILAWHVIVVVGDVHPIVLPTPVDVFMVYGGRFELFARSMYQTLMTVAVGFAMATSVGILFGILVYQWPRFRRGVYPYLVALYVIPKAVLVPLLIIWIGAGFTVKVLITFLLAFFPITDNTIKGLQGVDRDLLDLGRSLGSRPFRIFTRLALPSSLPLIFAGLKIGISEAFVGAVLVELMVPQTGIGSRIIEAVGPGNTDFIIAGIVTVAVVGLACYAILEWTEKKALFWHYE